MSCGAGMWSTTWWSACSRTPIVPSTGSRTSATATATATWSTTASTSRGSPTRGGRTHGTRSGSPTASWPRRRSRCARCRATRTRRTCAARLASEAGDDETYNHYAAKARDLFERFNEDFWLDEHGWYALGLDANKRPIDVLASNMGHCLLDRDHRSRACRRGGEAHHERSVVLRLRDPHAWLPTWPRSTR